MVNKLGKTLYLLMLLLIIGACFVGGYEALATPENQTPVTFPDPNLETAIRRALNKLEGAIYTSDLESLTELDAQRRGITDLTGLEYCTSLTYFSLQKNEISDISPLAGLTNLQSLDLGLNQISDISPLAGLTNLRELGLGGNPISNIASLTRLTKLQKLWLRKNQISDVSPLAGLTNLRELYLWSNQISDISPLAGLTNLEVLSLRYNQISDISPLASMTSLTFLGLTDNQISDISPLAGLTNLESLHLSYNQISDISPLAGLTNLESLHLGYNQISDISPLAGLPALSRVNLTDNPLSSASANIYIPLLARKGVPVRPHFQPIILNTIMFIALALVAIRIGITKRRMASWGWARRALQLSLITIVCGLAYYLTGTGSLHSAAFPISIFLVSFGAVVTFWSYRSRVSELVALALIALAPVSFFAAAALVGHFTDPYRDLYRLFAGPPSSAILAAAGVLFLLRRVRLRIAIIVSALVLLVGSGIAFLSTFMMLG